MSRRCYQRSKVKVTWWSTLPPSESAGPKGYTNVLVHAKYEHRNLSRLKVESRVNVPEQSTDSRKDGQT